MKRWLTTLEDYSVEIEIRTDDGDEHVRTEPLSSLVGWQRHAAELLHEEGSSLTFVDQDGAVTMTRKGSPVMTRGDSIRDMLEGEVAAKVRRIEFLDAVAAAGTVGELLASEDGAEWSAHAEDSDPAADLADVLDAEALEVVGVWRGSDRATAELDAVELLLCYGGPTVRATIDADGSVTVRGTWGSSQVERMAFAGTLAGWLFEMFEAGYR